MQKLKLNKVIILLETIRNGYRSLEQKIFNIYKESYTHRFLQKVKEIIKNYFRYSFLGRISEVKEENSIGLDKSKVVRWLINSYKKLQYKTTLYLKTNIINSSIKELKKEFYFFRIKTIGIIIVVAILTNILVSTILKKEIGLFGWIIRGLFLFLGLISLSCIADKEDIKSTSFILRYMNKSCKVKN